MHIDYEKFLSLLAENIGQPVEKVQKQIDELLTEMQSAFKENEAYEIENFGIFSELGQVVHFIPDEGLETEINYKYIGMEALEMPGFEGREAPAVSEENNVDEDTGNSFETDSDEPENLDAEVAAMMEDTEESERNVSDTEAKPDAIAEEEGAEETMDEILSEFIEMHQAGQEKTSAADIENEEAESEASYDPFADLLGGIGFSDSDDDSDTEGGHPAFTKDSGEEDTEREGSQKKSDVAAQDEKLYGLQSDFDTTSTDEQGSEDNIEALESEFPGEHESDLDLEQHLDFEDANLSQFDPAFELDDEESSVLGQEESEDEESELKEWGIDAHKHEGQEEAFTGLFSQQENEAEQKEDDELSQATNEIVELEKKHESKHSQKRVDDDFIPVVTDVSAGASKKTAMEDKKGKEAVKNSAKQQSGNQRITSILLYFVLIILITGFMGYILVFFDVINLNQITGNKEKVIQLPTPAPPPNIAESLTAAEENVAANDNETVQVPAGEAEEEPLSTVAEGPISGAEEAESVDYGLEGNVNSALNSGYTIVLYHLSNKSGAEREVNRLQNNNLRAMMKEIPSAKYGTLYRVSVGQFQTMSDAALAVDRNKNLFTDEYSITKIN